MSAAIQTATPDLRTELVNWKQRLESSAINSSDGFQLNGLLREVESAIERLTQQETYGVCQVCHDLIGQAAMNADPLARNCLSCFTPEQLRELEQDLDRAWLIQGESLPKQNLKFNGWEVSYHYEPAGLVSGDYCDLVNTETGDLYFLIGDVSGKGIAASLLMSRLHAIFRSLIGAGLAVNELVERANQIFGDTTMRPYYATLVCGKAAANGDLEICNAGHCPPLLVSGGEITSLPATGLPIGMFCQEKYSATRTKLNPGDRLLLYTDGLSEARNSNDHEYGDARLESFLRDSLNVSTPVLLTNLLDDLRQFSVAPRVTDDLTIMAIESVGH
ncbi:MAG TPA: PP2C family protein-serine/threonine phosphatase [Pyrinomonadaceae bacterium]|nr:PP2C family protein-serine/threonine phosphatase [Pyrinomonadaceae bacterium]